MDRRSVIIREQCHVYGVDDSAMVESSVSEVKNAMDIYATEMCLELLEYMAKNKYECFLIEDITGNITHCFSNNGRDYLTKQQLFENFL